MRWSHYNFLIESKKTGCYFLYNTLSNILFELTDKEYAIFVKIKDNIEKTDFLDKNLISNLKQYKVLVKDDNLEYIRYKLIIQSKRYNKEEMLLAISPRSKSAQSQINIMNKDIEYNIIQFIKSHTNLKNIHIIWYGTNIMLSDKRIKSLTKQIKSLNLDTFNSTILMSGVDIISATPNLINSLSINNIYIFFTDLEDNPYYSKNIDKIINGIESLSSYRRLHISVYLYKKNRTRGENIFNIIENTCLQKNINIYLLNKHHHRCTEDNQNCKKNKLLSLPSKLKSECIARHINGFIVDAEGYIYKCWSDINNKDKIIGHVTDRFNENIDLYTSYLGGSDPFEDNKCKICSFLPICGGGCPRKRIEREHYGENRDNCMISKDILKKMIENYYLKKIQ